MNIKEIKLNKILNLMEDIKKTDKIIDVGCGYGEITSFLNEKGYNIKGVDINQGIISKAEQMYPMLNFEVEDARNINYSEYKLIIAWGLFEYVSNAEKLLKKIEGEMKPNSLLIFAVPNVCSLSSRIKYLIGQNPDKEMILCKTYNLKQVKELMNNTDFRTKEIFSLNIDCVKNICFPMTKKLSLNIIGRLKK